MGIYNYGDNKPMLNGDSLATLLGRIGHGQNIRVEVAWIVPPTLEHSGIPGKVTITLTNGELDFTPQEQAALNLWMQQNHNKTPK